MVGGKKHRPLTRNAIEVGRAYARRSTGNVNDLCIGQMPNLPSTLFQPMHQIDFLVIEKVIRIEETDLADSIQPEHHGGTRDPVHLAGFHAGGEGDEVFLAQACDRAEADACFEFGYRARETELGLKYVAGTLGYTAGLWERG